MCAATKRGFRKYVYCVFPHRVYGISHVRIRFRLSSFVVLHRSKIGIMYNNVDNSVVQHRANFQCTTISNYNRIVLLRQPIIDELNAVIQLVGLSRDEISENRRVHLSQLRIYANEQGSLLFYSVIRSPIFSPFFRCFIFHRVLYQRSSCLGKEEA